MKNLNNIKTYIKKNHYIGEGLTFQKPPSLTLESEYCRNIGKTFKPSKSISKEDFNYKGQWNWEGFAQETENIKI